MSGILNVSRSALRAISVRVTMYVFRLKILVRGISLPAAQLFVIAVDNILRRCVGNLLVLAKSV